MIRVRLPHSGPENESLYTGITTWARRAPPRALLLLTVLGIATTAALAATGWERLPASGLGVTFACVGAWGLLEQRASPGPQTLQRVLVGLGIAGAVLAGLGLLLWMMGPAPIL